SRDRPWPRRRHSRALPAAVSLQRLSLAAGRQRLQHRGRPRGHGGRGSDAHRRAVVAVDPRLRRSHSPGHGVPELQALRPVPQVADRGAAVLRPGAPRFARDTPYITALVGVLGTTISPYLFFWQASHEVEQEKAQGRRTLAQRRGATAHELSDARLDVVTGMFFSNVAMFFIMLAT